MFFAISGACILFIFGLGCAALSIFRLNDEHATVLEELPFILTTGFLVNHLILLSVQSLKLSLWLGLVVSGCGLISFHMKRTGRFKFISGHDRIPAAIAVSILLLYYFAILLDPLADWDARSIWFFHAKMIWSAGTMGMNAGWGHPSLQFSHADYPMLIPAVAAQLSYILGYWNETMPKLALFLILIPPIFWVFSFYSRRFSFVFLALVFPFGLKSELWNGSMDGYLAFYAAVSMLLLGRYFMHRRLPDLISSMTCLALIGNIKNEGMLIGLAGMGSIAIIEMCSKPCRRVDLKKLLSLRRVGWLAMLISPLILWSVIYKCIFGLTNDLQLGTAGSFNRLLTRLSDGVSLPFILKGTFVHDESAVWLALAALIAGLAWLVSSRRRSPGWVPASITGILYYWGIVLVYLMTPSDLALHLATSVRRTMMSFSSCMLVGTYFVWKELEGARMVREQPEVQENPQEIGT